MAWGRINPRTAMAPMAAFTMACILFTYTRSSIRAAKMNAQVTRENQKQQRRQDERE